MHQDYKLTNKFLLEYYLDAFRVDTSYELRRAKMNDLKVAQNLAKSWKKVRKHLGSLKFLVLKEVQLRLRKNKLSRP